MAHDVFRIVGTTQAGSFHVERVVAEGGFSVVYRALHGAFRAPVALKCLKVPSDLSASQRDSYLERFREEAEILFRLSARIPEVVRPLHVDVLSLRDGRFVPFLALEWLEGLSLADMILARQGSGAAPMGLVKIVKLLSPVARALARAHRFPGPTGRVAIVHCDLKPENVFIHRVEGREEAKLLDYGIAMAMRSAGRKATGPAKPGEFVEPAFFTPGYAAPEQWSPKRFGPPGPKTDVWGLALTIVEAISGTSPLGDGTEVKMKAAALDEAKRPTPRALGAVVSDEIEDAFAKALVVQPAARTPDIATFWASLEAALALPPTFVRRDDRQDPDDPPSWVSSPRWNETEGGQAREPASPSPAGVRAPASPSPKEDRRRPSIPGLSLEEPFAEKAMPRGLRPSARTPRATTTSRWTCPSRRPRSPRRRHRSPLRSSLRACSILGTADPISGDELELAPPPPPSKRSGPRSAPPAVAAVDAPGLARAAFGSEPGPLALEIGVGGVERRARANQPPSRSPAPIYVPPTLRQDEPTTPRSLRGAVQLMILGAAIALVFVIGGQLAEPVRALGQTPKLVGVGAFVAGLLLLFWRMLER